MIQGVKVRFRDSVRVRVKVRVSMSMRMKIRMGLMTIRVTERIMKKGRVRAWIPLAVPHGLVNGHLLSFSKKECRHACSHFRRTFRGSFVA